MSEDMRGRAVAVVGVGCVMPDAPDVSTFWSNVKGRRYSISEVTKDRWDPALYWDADPKAPDKTYSKIGGWVRSFEWDPVRWHLPIPPRVAAAMDDAQKWAVACTKAALDSYGRADRLDRERTAVILGNAMAGERHYQTSLRISLPEIAQDLQASPSFAALPAEMRARVLGDLGERIGARLPPVTEDTMPGELANCMAGRVANLFDMHGPNYVCDAACASALAAMSAAIDGLYEHDFDAAITGGIDRNMAAATFVKFCKIGALSATGTRPFADGADGFVMGEGAAIFLLKRLEDAEAAGDPIVAVIRGIGGSSDGRGKGITAPNPVGQKLAIARAWKNAGLDPSTAGLIEGHGTSTRVGDVVEVESLVSVFGSSLPKGSIALGSVKSNIGHLKGAAGAAGILKAVLALRDKVLPPSLGFAGPNPAIDFARSPFAVNTELREWKVAPGQARRAAVSAFGFGGTNFHVVLEEFVPGRIRREVPPSRPRSTGTGGAGGGAGPRADAAPRERLPLRGALVLGAATVAELARQLERVRDDAAAGKAPPPQPPARAALEAPERIAIDYGTASELAQRAGKALEAIAKDAARTWKVVRAQGIFRGRGRPGKVAFLYTGQGSQYVNMLRVLAEREPAVAATWAEADRVMTPLLGGRTLTSYCFADPADEAAMAHAEEELRQTAITQPAILAADTALTRLLGDFDLHPDLVMGHSLGEYGALVAAGALPFADALEAVSARGREMTKVSVVDNGKMAAVFAPLPEIERILASVDGYCVIANKNSTGQAVIGGASDAVDRAMAACAAAGFQAVLLHVSHAFHTSIVAPASEPLRRTLERLHLEPPRIPIVANVTGEPYPMGPDARPGMLELLARQVASPVEFARGLETLYRLGARVFVEVGPKRALIGFADDVLGGRDDVSVVHTNFPKSGDVVSFNQALCALWAAGVGQSDVEASMGERERTPDLPTPAVAPRDATERWVELGKLFEDVLERSRPLLGGGGARGGAAGATSRPIVVTGAALGLPGTPHVFDDANVARALRGEQLIDVIPSRARRALVDKHIVRLVKSEAGGPHFESIESTADVIKLAGRGGSLDLVDEYGIEAERVQAFDVTTSMAIACGLDALRDAGIPLVLRYKTTTKGTQIPDRWSLPEAMRDDTGIVFASAFPGLDAFAEVMTRYHEDRAHRERLAELEHLRSRLGGAGGVIADELSHRIHELQQQISQHPFTFDRRFLFRVLAMGHSQFAELIGARGPNTQINAACASTTQAFAIADEWIREGRCRRVIVVSADDATSDRLLEWIGAGFLASGAAAIDEAVEEAAVPFDRRRHGMIVGMGAGAVVLESAEAAAERGIRPICEVLGTVAANSAFHGTRLDVAHIRGVMESLVRGAEQRWGVSRADMARELVFVSHETYTPARGGSASAEIEALRHVFGERASHVVIANTKGFTGHAMGAGIEDVVAVKILETGIVPPIANFREPDPELGDLQLSKGGPYPVRYALRLAAGFGSQVAMTLMRWSPSPDGHREEPDRLGYATRIADEPTFRAWLARASGQTAPVLEVNKRTLRVHDAVPVREVHLAEAAPPAPPAVRAPAPAPAPEIRPAASAPPPVHVPVPVPVPDAGAPAPNEVLERVLALVTEKTGYPRDMLDPDLDLEADLGIDTVKQAEMFAAIREAYGIPRQDSVQLRDFSTLTKVVGFVLTHRPDLAASAPPPVHVPVPVPDSGAPASNDVLDRVLALVTEKTGYPRDMLDPDLDLEADLGIDTVKQAEMFAAIREAYGIPRQDSVQLRDFSTLTKVVGFVLTHRPDLAASAPPPVHVPVPVPDPSPAAADPADGAPRRVPVPVLRPSLDQCKPTGVALAAGHRVVIVTDRGGAAAALSRQLALRGVDAILLDPPSSSDALVERLDVLLADGPVQGLYWLPALDDEGDLMAMDLAGWQEATRVRVKLLYAAARRLYGALAARGTFLVSATRLGGLHGYGPDGATAPIGGAVVGLTKTFARERPEALVKAVDFTRGAEADEIAGKLVAETLHDPGAVEIARPDDLRFGVGLIERPAADGAPGLALGQDTVFLVTGAAGSIVSAITADLARAAGGGTFYLFDLVAEPDPADPDLARFRADLPGLRRELFDRMKASGERATPALVEKRIATLERAASAASALAAVRAAGGEARWISTDLRDHEAVTLAVGDIVRAHGRVDVVLHAGGLEISHLLPDKSPAEFDLVFDVKANGWYSLLHALAGAPIGATVVFSSIAGRFGNAGQADYAAANDLLCKTSRSLIRTRPGTRAIALDWTAWGGIGMATRGSIPKMMELAGIDMLPPEVGIATVRRELTRGATRDEVVVALGLGVLVEPRDPTGGLDLGWAAARPKGPIGGRVLGLGHDGAVRVEMTLDPKTLPFLDHHRIDGTAVLPGVMGIEAFAEAATTLMPGWRVTSIEDVEFLAPFKFYRDEPRAFTVEAHLVQGADGGVDALCRLTGVRTLPGQESRPTTHFTARVRLGREAPSGAADPPPKLGSTPTVGAQDLYRVYFHGPAYQVLQGVHGVGREVVGVLGNPLPSDQGSDETPWVAAPRLVELVFQTAGALEIGTKGVMGLPRRVASVMPVRPLAGDRRITAVVTPEPDGAFGARVVDDDGTLFCLVRGYHTVALPQSIDPALGAPFRALSGRASP